MAVLLSPVTRPSRGIRWVSRAATVIASIIIIVIVVVSPRQTLPPVHDVLLATISWRCCSRMVLAMPVMMLFVRSVGQLNCGGCDGMLRMWSSSFGIVKTR